MEATTTTSNSQVTVQCTDPSSLLETLNAQLNPRLPLRHLHWKSPSRPLRSIETLNVSLLRDGSSEKENGGGSRRHQIAGLQQSPYVKLYLLRCDEKLQYKESVRKELKQWVKTCNTLREKKAGQRLQEQYDTFEWLIVHVVLPDTPAANEPRSNKHLSVEEASESTDSLPTKGTWTGKKSSTIYDKLRSDFSGSKATIDKVAQVRIPGPPGTANALSPADVNEQWQDLVDRLKSLILKSFDTRVAQYEVDIREREAQRSLPGWNFCTYFVLKESLARSFASVGLLEDSLSTYSELTVELDAIVRTTAIEVDSDTGTGVLPFSNDLKPIIRKAIGHLQHVDTLQKDVHQTAPTLPELLQADKSCYPFDLERKDYLNLILTNQVSGFDLRVYIFARVLEILRRQIATPSLPSTRIPNGHTGPQASTIQKIDSAALTKIYDRGTQFVNLAARNLRQEFYRAWGGQQGLDADELQTQARIINGAVASWTWVAALQLLSVESSQVVCEADPDKLEFPVQVSDRPLEQNGPYASQDKASTASSESVSSQDIPQDGLQRTASSRPVPGSIEALPIPERRSLLVGKILIMMRDIIMSLEPDSTQHNRTTSQPEVEQKDTQDSAESIKHVRKPSIQLRSRRESLAAIQSETLVASTQSVKVSTKTYRMLSAAAFNHFVVARKFRSARLVILDLAALAYKYGHVKAAAHYFDKITDLRQEHGVTDMSAQALEMYLQCLYLLGRATDHIRCSLKYVDCRIQLAAAVCKSASSTDQKLINEVKVSSRTADRITLPLTRLVRVRHVGNHIHFQPDFDGFCISGSLQLKLDVELDVEAPMILRLKSLENAEPSEIELTCNVSRPLSLSPTPLVFHSNVSTTGWYELSNLEIVMGNVLWVHRFQAPSRERDSEELRPQSTSQNMIYVYPSNNAMTLSASVDRVLDLSQRRTLAFTLRNGSFQVEKCSIKLKSGTAGLRLHLHETKLQEENEHFPHLELTTLNGTSLVEFDDLDIGHDTRFLVPYSLEQASTSAIELKVTITCERAEGTFIYHDNLIVKTILPVTVNVQDFFKSSCMYSRFTVSPATPVPLRLFACRISESLDFEIISGPTFEQPLDLFPKQSGSWAVRLKQIPRQSHAISPQRVQLAVDYQCIDEQFLTAFEYRLEADLRKGPVAFATRLLCFHAVSHVQKNWTEHDLEIAALTRQVEVWSYEEFEWHEALMNLSREQRPTVEAWLKDWHSRTSELDMNVKDVPLRTLKLNVDVPTMPALVVVRYELSSESNKSHIYPVGAPIFAELVVMLIPNSLLSERPEANVEVLFEVVPPADMWLVGGRRKGTFVPGKTPSRFELVMIPQRTGHLHLPAIDIKCQKEASSSTWTSVHVEVEDQSQASSVLVSAGLVSSTVGLSEGDFVDGPPVLVDSVSR